MSLHLATRLRQNAWPLFLGILVTVSIVLLGFVFYSRGRSLMETELKERLRSMAAIAAQQFDPADLDRIHTIDDMDDPVYAVLVQRLDAIRAQSPDVRFTYILRPLAEENEYEFVADADSISPVALKDLNGDGVLDESDEPAPPGTPYSADSDTIARGQREPVTDEEPYTDQWGTYMSGFAPIRRADGTIAGVLGVDIDAGHFLRLSQRIFSPVIVLLGIFAGLLIAVAFIQSSASRRVAQLKLMEEERAGLLRLTYHQLGQPLTILKWSIETVGEGNPDPAELKNQMKNLKEATARIDAVFQALGKADRVHRGESLQYAKTPVSVSMVIRQVMLGADAHIQRRRIRTSVNIDDALTVSLDQSLIGGVIDELVRNAIDYSPEGSEVSIEARRRKNFVEISVSDSGVGIPQNELSKIATEYFRASNAPHMKPDGNGLGLFVSRGIVERAGGEFTVHSQEGKGTRVTFTLPLQS